MANDKGITKPCAAYNVAAAQVKQVRDTLNGEVVIRDPENIDTHLPDPFPHLTEDDDKTARLRRYRANAEFDEVVGNTGESLVGAMFRKRLTFEDIPAGLEYLVDDADGDGAGLEETAKSIALEQFGFNFVAGLAEFSDLASMDLDAKTLTRAKAREAGLRAFIKIYPREAVIDWNFRRINKTRQLDYIVLKEQDETRDEGDNFAVTKRDSYLVLYLDGEGVYTQIRYTVNQKTGGSWSDPFQPQMRGAKMKYIPLEFAIASPSLREDLPKKLGYLSGIASKVLARFRASGDYKECLWLNGAPMTSSSGWDTHAHEQYQKMTGLRHVPSGPGAHFMRPAGIEYEIHAWNAGQSAYADYLSRNEREIRALGGVFDTTDGDPETAKAAAIKHAEKTGVLAAVADSTEKMLNKLIMYCGMFQGIQAPADVVKIPRDFIQSKITPQERNAILNERDAGLYDDEEALKQLKQGGALVGEVDDLRERMNNTQNGGS
jgi:hypothetical protein